MTTGSYPFGAAPFGSDLFGSELRPWTIEERIEAALFEHVILLELPGSPLIAWPNNEFPRLDASKPRTFIEVRNMPNHNTRIFVKGNAPHIRQGILQIKAATPLNIGQWTATGLGGEIARQCPADFVLWKYGTKVRIQAAPHVGPASAGPAYWEVYVSIPYECLE